MAYEINGTSSSDLISVADALRFSVGGTLMPLLAAGNGTGNDALFLNQLFISAVASGLPVRLKRGANYRVGPVGTKGFINPSGNIIIKNYCIELPDGLDIDWNGATISCVAGLDAIVLSNKNTAATTDVVTMRGKLKVDGGGASDTLRTVPMVWFYGLADGSIIKGIDVRNCSYVGGTISTCFGVEIDKLNAQDIRGQGWVLGGNTVDKIKQCKIGTLTAQRINTYGTFNQPGNGFLIGGEDLSIQRILQRNCAGGIKIAPNSLSIHIDHVITDGTVLSGETNYNSQNCGFKVQGDDVNTKPHLITVSLVKCKKQAGAGLFIRFSNTVTIDVYEGDHNGTLGLDADVDIGSCDTFSANIITSSYAGISGCTLASGTGTSDINTINIYNAAEITESNAYGFSPLGGQFRVGSLYILDNRTTIKSWSALRATSTNTPGVIDNYRTNLSNRLDIRATQIEVRNPRFESGYSPLSGRITLTASNTSTTISNNNSVSQSNASGFVEPVIQITPINAQAKLLGVPYYYIISNQSFTLIHPAAQGNEIFEYTILGYRFDAVKRTA